MDRNDANHDGQQQRLPAKPCRAGASAVVHHAPGATDVLMVATAIFYFHPSTKATVSPFQTETFLPEAKGRVAETYVSISQHVKEGDPLFRLDSAEQEADPAIMTGCTRPVSAHCSGYACTPSTRSA